MIAAMLSATDSESPSSVVVIRRHTPPSTVISATARTCDYYDATVMRLL